MITTTTPSVEGRPITAYHGIVVGEAIYVTVTVDTEGLSQTSDLSGKLSVSANAAGS